MPLIESAAPDRRPIGMALFVAGILLAVVSIPYLFPAPVSISRSYVAGFNNHVAIGLFFLGSALFALFTRGRIAAFDSTDSSLSPPVLALGMAGTLACCLHASGIAPIHPPGGEAYYALNRLQMAAAGLAPYKQFEFVYGPLLLYPVLWMGKLLHVSVLQAYVLTWLIFWMLGVAMIWTVVRALDFPLRSRLIVFAFLLLTQLVWARYGGLSYSALRAYLATFCIVAIYGAWKRGWHPWILCLASIMAVAVALCCSMDQAIAAAAGLAAFLLLLALSPEQPFSWAPFAATLAGFAACFALAGRAGLLRTPRSFNSGGYSYPLLPSPSIFLALFAYIVALCVLYRCVRARFLIGARGEPALADQLTVSVPLAVAGCAMIPAALGRCDILHISAATPAFVVGTAAICAMPTVRRWWLPAAFVGLVVLPCCFGFILRHVKLPHDGRTNPPVTADGYTGRQPSDNQWYVSDSELPGSALPCDRQYFSPAFMPVPTEKFLPACLDTGYYAGFTDVITPATIDDKVNELRAHAAEPLLLENIPLEVQLPRQLAATENLYLESESFWVPRVRNPPLTFAPIINYIRQHYAPGPEIDGGRIRIWYPIDASARHETQANRPEHAP